MRDEYVTIPRSVIEDAAERLMLEDNTLSDRRFGELLMRYARNAGAMFMANNTRPLVVYRSDDKGATWRTAADEKPAPLEDDGA